MAHRSNIYPKYINYQKINANLHGTPSFMYYLELSLFLFLGLCCFGLFHQQFCMARPFPKTFPQQAFDQSEIDVSKECLEALPNGTPILTISKINESLSKTNADLHGTPSFTCLRKESFKERAHADAQSLTTAR